MIDPKLNKSAFNVYPLFLSISGATYEGVPHFLVRISPSVAYYDNPKSAILTS